MLAQRIDTLAYDDGLNAWSTARASAAPALAGQVSGYADYWERTEGFTTRRELPHSDGVLIFNLDAPISITSGDGSVLCVGPGEAFIAGAHLRPALSHSGGTQAGVHVYLPLMTLRRLLRAPMHDFVDRAAPLEALLGAPARALGERLLQERTAAGRMACLDRALATALAATPAIGRPERHALRLLRAQPGRDIADIARDIGWSRKHLATRLRDTVGVGPRCFRRLVRFQMLLGRLPPAGTRPDWAEIALDAGYCDQSHMIREFRAFSGLTPAAYLARILPDGGGLPEG